MDVDYNFFFLINLFICVWLCWVFVAARGLFLVAVSGDHSSLWCAGFSLRWLLLLRSTGSRSTGLSSCGSWVLECRLSSCGATGLIAPRHVGSSRLRAWTCVPCIGRQILNHCATREALDYNFYCYFAVSSDLKIVPSCDSHSINICWINTWIFMSLSLLLINTLGQGSANYSFSPAFVWPVN